MFFYLSYTIFALSNSKILLCVVHCIIIILLFLSTTIFQLQSDNLCVCKHSHVHTCMPKHMDTHVLLHKVLPSYHRKKSGST